jgi:hypothetical protein
MKHLKIQKEIKDKKAEIKELESEIKELEKALKLNKIVRLKNTKTGLEFETTEERAQKFIKQGKAELITKK